MSLQQRAHVRKRPAPPDPHGLEREMSLAYLARVASVVGTEAFEVLKLEIQTAVEQASEICMSKDPVKDATGVARAQGAKIALISLQQSFELSAKRLKEEISKHPDSGVAAE